MQLGLSLSDIDAASAVRLDELLEIHNVHLRVQAEKAKESQRS